MRFWMMLLGLCCCINLFAVDSDGDGLSDEVEKKLGTPADNAAEFHSVYKFKLTANPVHMPKKLKEISIAHIAEDRFLWKAEFLDAPNTKELVWHCYVDADADTETGRKGKAPGRGTDYMCSIAFGRASLQHYDKAGKAVPEEAIRWHQEGNILYLLGDTPMTVKDGRTASIVHFVCHSNRDRKSKRISSVSSPKVKISIPLKAGKKILRATDYREPFNMKRTYGIDMIKKFLFATAETVHVPYDKLLLDGFSVDLNNNRHFGGIISSKVNDSVYTKAPAGKYYPAILVFDRGLNNCFEMTIDGKSVGVAPVNIGNNRYWFYYLDKPVKFRGGEEVRVFSRRKGSAVIHSIAFLPVEPPSNGLPYKISHLCTFTPQGKDGNVSVSWLTEMPSISRFEYGKNGAFDKTAERSLKTLVHRVQLSGLEPDAVYTGRAVAFRPDGTKYVSKEITFKAIPIAKKSGSVSRAALPVKVSVSEAASAAPGLVTTGIPFPKGALSVSPAFRLSLNGAAVPVQYKVTGWWDDGSAKWVLFSFVTPAGKSGDLIYDLEYGNDIPEPKAEKAMAEIRKDGVYVNGVKSVDANGQLLVYRNPVKTVFKLAEYPKARWDKKTDLSIEYNGHVRAVVKSVRKLNAPDGTALVALEQRFTFAAGSPAVEIAHTFTVLHGKPFLDFESLEVHVPLINASFPYPYYQRNEKEIRCADGVITGKLDGTFTGRLVSVAVRDFWQNYPKGFGAGKKYLSIQLCPKLTDDYYDKFPFEKEGHHLFYYLRDKKYRFKSDMSKTHHITVVSTSEAHVANAAAEQGKYRLLGVAPAKWYCGSGAFYSVMPQDYEKFGDYEKRTDDTFRGYRTMRHKMRDYGMMNFGDWYPERGANWGNSEYDTQLAFFLQFIRSGDKTAFFQGEEMEFHNRDIDTPASTGAVKIHQMGHLGEYYKESVPNTLGIPKASTSISHAWAEGDFIHYFLTGDVRSYETACRKVSYYVDKTFQRPYDFTSLRVPGWHLIMNSYALASTNDPAFLNASHLIVERVLEMQDKVQIPLPEHQHTPEHKSYIGGWMRMMVPGHCVCIPRCKGNANFMVAVLLSGLKYYHDVTGDPRVKTAIINGASYLADSCYSEKHAGFRYTPCMKMKFTFGVSPLMTEGFARAYLWTKDEKFVHALKVLLAKPVPKRMYGKSFSMYYRIAPRVMADIAKGGIDAEGLVLPESTKTKKK